MSGSHLLAHPSDSRTHADAGLAALRVFAGLALMLAHGLGKLPPSPEFVAGVADMGFPAPVLFAWAAGLSESAGGLFLALGLLTRVSAGFILATMTVAAFLKQAGDPFTERELAMLYAAVMVMFIASGGGRFSLDAFIRSRASAPSQRNGKLARAARVAGAMLMAALVACSGAQGEPGPDDATLRIAYVRPENASDASVTRGVTLGAEEVQRAAELIGRNVELVSVDAGSAEEIAGAAKRLADDGVIAIIGGVGDTSCRTLADVAAQRAMLFVNVGCRDDALRAQDTTRFVFHVEASDSMYRSVANDEGEAALWHPTLFRFGAAQLNDRFRSRFGAGADGSAWAGWMAVKLVWEASQRAASARPGDVAAYLASAEARFDGHKGRQLSFDPRTGQLDQPLYAIDEAAITETEAGEVEPTHPVLPPDGLPSGSGRLLLVSNEGSETVSIIDTERAEVIGTIPVPARPRGIQVSRDGSRALVALSDDAPRDAGDGDAIAVIDLATGSTLASHPGGTDPEQFAIAPDGSRLYVANEDAGTLSITDLATGRVVATLVVGIEPEGVAVSPDSRWVYVTAETSNTVSVIDTRVDEVVANFLVDVRPRAVTFSADGSRAYITAEIGGSVAVVHVPRHEVLATVELDDAAKPVGVVVSGDGSRVYVANGHAHSVSVIDPAAGRVVQTIDVGERPWGLALSPDGRRLYTANGGSDDVSIVDLERGVEVARVRVGGRPWGVVVTP